jgi:hypothetical protein
VDNNVKGDYIHADMLGNRKICQQIIADEFVDRDRDRKGRKRSLSVDSRSSNIQSRAVGYQYWIEMMRVAEERTYELKSCISR